LPDRLTYRCTPAWGTVARIRDCIYDCFSSTALANALPCFDERADVYVDRTAAELTGTRPLYTAKSDTTVEIAVMMCRRCRVTCTVERAVAFIVVLLRHDWAMTRTD
jgi:hypothetical protein